MDNSLIVDEMNIAELSDEELVERLQALGFNTGPILISTREVYQRKLARLLRNEDFEEDLAEDDNEDISTNEDVYTESQVLNKSYNSSYSGSPSLNVDDLRRRPLSRVEGHSWSDDPPTLSPHKPWSPDDIVSQVQPPPGEEEKPLISNSSIAIALVAFLMFVFFVYYNMESTPQTPFS